MPKTIFLLSNLSSIHALLKELNTIFIPCFSFQGSQSDSQKQNDPKDDMVESDIEFVETGPQVIEIPDANDSR